jgi:hypothetical protein
VADLRDAGQFPDAGTRTCPDIAFGNRPEAFQSQADAVTGLQAEGTAAGEHNRVNVRVRGTGMQGFDFAGTGCRAAYMLPVSPTVSVAWPTRIPGTSVNPFISGLCMLASTS